MCDRCPIGGRYPSYPWPGQRPAGGDLGPPPDLGWPDRGAPPPIRWFWQPSDQMKSLWRGRWDNRPKFLCDGR
jgi:hypothetical protein